jgi:serine/threonine-protein kinase HipA
MTLLNKSDQQEASYLDLAEFLATKGSDAHINRDLLQLFRRVLFNVATSNRDDHLRNHGFLRDPKGWRLAPAYDMNPSTRRDTHVLALDDQDTSPSLATVLKTAAFYRVADAQAVQICNAMLAVLAGWESKARQLGLSAEDRAELEDAFATSLPHTGTGVN